MKHVAAIVDSSVLIDYLAGTPFHEIDKALAVGALVLSPLVLAELLSGDLTIGQRDVIGSLLQDYPLHETTLQHWINVGELRRLLRSRGVNLTIPDAHVAQCALDLDAVLYSRDDVFTLISEHTSLRLGILR